MTKRPSNKVTQILTGHCVLNAHQHRFGFVEDPSCSCGEPIESLNHFLFFCPTYNVIRKVFRDISLEVYNIWPPELSMIPRSEALWRAMKSFIVNSKRIDVIAILSARKAKSRVQLTTMRTTVAYTRTKHCFMLDYHSIANAFH
jgi:hypothetical protein